MYSMPVTRYQYIFHVACVRIYEYMYNIGIEGEMRMQTGTKIRLNDQIYKYPDIKVFISSAIFNCYAKGL